MWTGFHRPPSWCEAHHLHGWNEEGGLTNVDDGILLCVLHHLRLHNSISTSSIQEGEDYPHRQRLLADPAARN